jgi:probable HAF family extracellular repeat protein
MKTSNLCSKRIVRTSILAGVVAGAIYLSLGPSALAGGYNFQQIKVPGSASTVASGTNDSGNIVGFYYDAGGIGYGFLLQQGVYTTIGVPGAASTQARGINNNGDIVGHFADAAGKHVFLLRNGQFSTIDFPGAVGTTRPGINNLGDIVGVYTPNKKPSGAGLVDEGQAFLLHNGVFKTISYPGALATGAFGINSFGEIVGDWSGNAIVTASHGYILSNGNFTALDYPGAVPGLGGTDAHGINDSRQIVGAFVDVHGVHGYVWNADVFTAIDVPAGVPGTTQVYGINSWGQIVGFYQDAVTGGRVGFVATPGP